ncbi:AMP-binding protein [Methylogaea oryzae]|uniref:AMP-binding protein n=1 Tax=Methylogaea oryzae TaxID=1295382 RepID=UPI0006D0F99B|nr:AMP-binding protein [Methylogaea oryzae]
MRGLQRHRRAVAANVLLAPGFERQAQAAPDAVAFIDGTRRITYRELDERANQLARHLQTLGVGPEVPVGLYSRRCADLALAILGILKAGGAYVPLDPEYPKARIRYILEQAKPALVLTQAALAGELPDDARILRLDGDWPSVAEYSAEPLPSRVTGDNLAYVLYTSGSTGQPKGVAVEHRSGAAFMGWIGSAFRAEIGRRAVFHLRVFRPVGVRAVRAVVARRRGNPGQPCPGVLRPAGQGRGQPHQHRALGHGGLLNLGELRPASSPSAWAAKPCPTSWRGASIASRTVRGC